jgi:hypothetical protein
MGKCRAASRIHQICLEGVTLMCQRDCRDCTVQDIHHIGAQRNLKIGNIGKVLINYISRLKTK